MAHPDPNAPGAPPGDAPERGPEDGPGGGNRLAGESSPYLRQHADNPVDWYPWGEAAFERARAEDRPVLLSVGYSACHWCHVMAHESFEDAATAADMNRWFVNVKVDREERPDVDAIYMSAVQAMTGQGGWPMTVAMTPDGRPFFAGTYFPKEPRFGQPPFRRVLAGLADAWDERRDEVERAADGAARAVRAMQRAVTDESGGAEPEAATVDAAREALAAAFDGRHGGFGGAPKFPPHGALRFLLRQWGERERAMAETTLLAMADGGIFDQLGGGFARYSVDAIWRVPHFEKMLYDNAQLLGAYAEAHARSGEARFRETALATAAFLERELRAPGGGFYSALDADSEGEEGRFYAWSAREFDAVAGADAALARSFWGVTETGDFEGGNVLHRAAPLIEVARAHGLEPEETAARLERVRERLLARRAERVRPGLDDKVLTSWNGLAIGGLAEAARYLDEPHLADLARGAAEFLRETMWTPGAEGEPGRLRHSWHADSGARIEGLLEDYAWLGLGLLELYRTTFETRWLRWALELAEGITARFADAAGGFFSTPEGGEALLVRPKDLFDGPTPAPSNAAALLLLRLARVADRPDRERAARAAVAPLREAVARQPSGFAAALLATEELLAPPREVVVAGPPGREDTRALLAPLRAPLPFTALLRVDGADDPLAEVLPLAAGRGEVEGAAAAYVCRGGACRLPVTTPEALEAELAAG